MKKTLIALFALAGVALAVETKTLTYTVDLSSNAYDGYKSKPSDSTGWENLGWGQFSAANVETDLSLLDITSAGNYGFNHAGTSENTTYGFGVGYTEGTLTLIGRNGVGQETLFASVVDVSTILGGNNSYLLSGLSVTTTVTNGSANSDSWWGLYKMDAEGGVVRFSDVCNNAANSHNDLRNKTTETITLTSENLSSIQDTDKLVVLYRQGAGGKSLGINSLTYTATIIPEPTTATLSLLALAGLAARRRRASR